MASRVSTADSPSADVPGCERPVQHEVECLRMRELRGRAEPAVRPVGLPHERPRGRVEHRRGWLAGGGQFAWHHRRAHLLAHRADLLALRVVRGGGSAQHCGKTPHALAVARRKVRPRIEGKPGRGEEDGERPATLHAHRLSRAHVDGVDVGPFLAVDLDAHEEFVHERRDLGVLERFVRHHVAPVTRAVADGEQHGTVVGASGGKRRVAPRVPVDRVTGVLEEIRAGTRAPSRLATTPR